MPCLTAKTSFKKTAGTLELNDTHLQWTQDAQTAPSIRFERSQLLALFCSKAGAAQVKLKVTTVDHQEGHFFTFLAQDHGTAVAEREKFKAELTAIMGRNKETSAVSATPVAPVVSRGPPPPPITSSTSSFAPAPVVASVPSALPVPGPSRAVSISADVRSMTSISGEDPARDFRLRKTVLLGNPDLAALHRELVFGGQISEAEFWEGREHLVLAQAAQENQRKGKPGQLVDPRPETVEGGETKIRITPQLVHDIFDEYPVVARAYSDTVPQKLSEEQFWKRYFQSKLFNAHRASIRSAATQHVVKEDPIFDKYLERDDDELEPRRQLPKVGDLYVNLGATREDHEETGNEKDVTMQAGRQRGALPLIRKFNEHSERLLSAALGEEPPAKKQRTDDYNAAIELDDLNDPEAASGITLEMQDSQRYFEGRQGTQNGAAGQAIDIRSIIMGTRDSLESWQDKLGQLKIERKAGDAAFLSMSNNVYARLDVRSRKNDIPEAFFSQMRTCQTAANEFLRQFWAAMAPPVTEAVLAPQTPAQRVAKAAKMAAYLARTHEKVSALVAAGMAQGIDPQKIQTALQPVLNAVDRALNVHRVMAAKKVPGRP
ncbi:hypothetical protein CYLTODRAFT_416282, partial [Cylindrobasidium torrendii FP15055 ss-10]